MDYSKIKASITIQEGEIIVNGMFYDDTKIVDENSQLVIMRNIASDAIFNYEKKYQQQFRPNGNTKYILPKEDQ